MILNDNDHYWDDLNELVDCLRLLDASHRATTLTITKCCRGSRSYYKLNRFSIKRNELIEWHREKMYYFLVPCVCITRRIMKKRAEKKREKISSERRRLIEELHALARKNFPRRRVIVQGYDDLWLISLKCARTQASIKTTITYSPSSMCWASVGRTTQDQEARWLTLSLRSFERVEDVRKIYKRIWKKSFTTLICRKSWKNTQC